MIISMSQNGVKYVQRIIFFGKVIGSGEVISATMI